MKRLFSFRTLLFLTSTILLSLLSCSHHSEISLSSLDLSATKQGWGKVQIGKSITGEGVTYCWYNLRRGGGTHANSTIRILLKKKTGKFHGAGRDG